MNGGNLLLTSWNLLLKTPACLPVLREVAVADVLDAASPRHPAVAKHVEGCLVANRIRCLRNLLARLLSLHDHNVAGTDSCEEAGNLKRNIQRCPYLPSGLGLTAQILHVTEDIRKSEAELKQGQLDRWRDRLCGSVSACFKWVRGSSCTYTHMVCLGDETSSDSLSEAIDRLKRYWESVWNRPLPNLDDQFASCARVLGPSRETADWGPLQGSELHKAGPAWCRSSTGANAWGSLRRVGRTFVKSTFRKMGNRSVSRIRPLRLPIIVPSQS